MFSKLTSGVITGIDAETVEVQSDVASGLPAFQIVGLPEKEVSESRDRVRSAIKNSGYSFPSSRITANLAPADLRKEGVGFDLPIALGILSASQQISSTSDRLLLLGELSLDGELRPVRGVLPIALAAAKRGLQGLIVPTKNAPEAALVEDIDVYPASTLLEAADILCQDGQRKPFTIDREKLMQSTDYSSPHDISAVKGQEQAKRALEVAASGGHNLLLTGPPGAGKSMLTRCLPGILPPLSFDEALEITRIYSSAGLLEREAPFIVQRPFRSPHHTISYAGMVGGGHGIPGPGEISLAHHGVLFLDELPEFGRQVLETLRQPLEDRTILISRAGVSVRYPASFALVCAMNPCPCGHLGDPRRSCTCTSHEVKRYRKKISGPFLDRIDMFIEVPRLPRNDLINRPSGETSDKIRARVTAAREIQWQRTSSNVDIHSNSQLDAKAVGRYCKIDKNTKGLLEKAIDRFSLSARAYNRVLKVARTIADLDNAPKINKQHLAEAIQYRPVTQVLT